MKKHLLLIAAVATLFAWSCNKDKDKPSDDKSKDPVETSVDPEDNPEAGEFNVYAVEQDGKKTNKIVLEVKSNKIQGSFDYSYGQTEYGKAKSEVTVPVLGEIPIVFKGTNTTTFEEVTENFTVTVEALVFDIPEGYKLLCGEGSKTWTWDEDYSENGPWGESGFRTEYEPWDDFWDDFEYFSSEEGGWWGRGATITFSLEGGTKFIKTNSQGESENGTFTLDFTNPLLSVYNEEGLDEWPVWSVGNLHLNDITLPAGDNIENYRTEEVGPVYDFYIVELSEDQLILACYIGWNLLDDITEYRAIDDDEWEWDEIWMWIFKPAE